MTDSIESRISFSMSNKKRKFSIPKTQPTRSSSRQRTYSTQIQKKQQIETCPQITQFKIIDDQLYTHRMNLDYGHLKQPDCLHNKIVQTRWDSKYCSSQKLEKFAMLGQQSRQVLNSPLTIITDSNNVSLIGKTKNFIKLAKSESMKNDVCSNQKAQTNTPRNGKFSARMSNQNIEIENLSTIEERKKSEKPKSSSRLKFNNCYTDQQNPKLKQVVARNLKLQQSTAMKNNSQLSTQRMEVSKESIGDREKTQRRVPHCRIVKSYVGGSKMQIKIISYPDSSEYRKFCGLLN